MHDGNLPRAGSVHERLRLLFGLEDIEHVRREFLRRRWVLAGVARGRAAVISLSDLERRVSRVLTSPTSGIEVRLRSVEELGFGPLKQLLALLGAQAEDPLLLGYYRFGGDEGPGRVLGESLGVLTLVPDTERDWRLWSAVVRDLDALKGQYSWPDLLVDAGGRWLLWTEDNQSFLHNIAERDLDLSQ